MRPPELLHSATFRLALIYTSLFAASVGVLLIFIYWSTAAYMTRQADATVEAEVAGLAEQYRSEGLAALTRRIAERSSRKPGGSAIYLLTDPAFDPIVGNLNRWPADATRTNGWLSFALRGGGWPAGEVHRARAKPFLLPGGYHLLVGSDLHDLERTRRLIERTLWWGIALTAALALGGGYLVTRATVRRLETINATSREIMSGHLSRRIPTRGSSDEFDQLAANLNRMLDRIEALMEDVRRVSDNIAHDLRTPLTRLRTRLEELRPAAVPDAERHEAIEQAVADADGLLATFNALLRIARAETESRRAGFRELDLAELVHDVTELYEPLAEDQGQTLRVLLAGRAPLHGDRDLLFQAIANLLDNAVKYTRRGGAITIRLEPSPAGAHRLIISDNGPGIPDAAKDQVFQRFYRLEQSRSAPGNGLGLSLVAAVARLHRIAITLEDAEPGLRVVLQFPAREDSARS